VLTNKKCIVGLVLLLICCCGCSRKMDYYTITEDSHLKVVDISAKNTTGVLVLIEMPCDQNLDKFFKDCDFYKVLHSQSYARSEFAGRMARPRYIPVKRIWLQVSRSFLIDLKYKVDNMDKWFYCKVNVSY